MRAPAPPTRARWRQGLLDSRSLAVELLAVAPIVVSADAYPVLNVEPRTYDEMLRSADVEAWRGAMEAEYAAHIENGTWRIVPMRPGMNVVGSRWVFKVKRNSDGSVDRFKARFVAQGFLQREGVDYTATFSPVSHFNSVRSLISIGNALN